MSNPAQHINQAVKKHKRVYFVGTASTFFKRGTGLCYNRDYGTAGDREPSRDKRVEVPSTSNNRNFAGVLDHDVTLPSTGKAWVTINEPGSVCDIALGSDATINTPYLTCLAGGGDNTSRFCEKGFLGRGSAIPFQTVTAILEDGTDGTGSLATDGYTLTVSDSSDFTAGVDKVMILASEDEGSSKIAAVGIYEIDSITNGTTIVINDGATSICGATPGDALAVSYLVIDGDNDTCLARLCDGEESGLTTWVSIANGGDTDAAPMMGGVTYCGPAATLTADWDFDLPDGTIYGEKIGFIVMGALTTKDVTVDLDTNGLQLDGSALADITAMDTAADACFLQWDGIWRTTGIVGNATEA